MTTTWSSTPDALINVRLLLKGWYFEDALGTQHTLAHVDVTLKEACEYYDFAFRPGVYAGVRVAHAEFIADGVPLSFVLVIHEDKPARCLCYTAANLKIPD